MIVAPMDDSVQHALGLRECSSRILPLADCSCVRAAASRYWFAVAATGANATAPTVLAISARHARERPLIATNRVTPGALNMPCARAVGASANALGNK